MAIRPEQPQSIGGVLDTTFQLYKASLGRVWALCIIGALGGLLSTIYELVALGEFDPTDPGAAAELIMDPGYLLVLLVAIVLSLWSFGAIYLRMNAVGTGTPMTLGSALGAAFRRVPMLMVLGILFMIAIVVGWLLLVVPGVILTVSLILCFNLLLVDGKGPVAALTGSHHLVWGNWWRTAAVLTIGFVVVIVIYSAVGLLVGFAMPTIMRAEDPVVMGAVIGLMVGILGTLVITPFYTAMVIALYWDLKLRKEGEDLAARVSALGTA
jgi:hypothetical protein